MSSFSHSIVLVVSHYCYRWCSILSFSLFFYSLSHWNFYPLSSLEKLWLSWNFYTMCKMVSICVPTFFLEICLQIKKNCSVMPNLWEPLSSFAVNAAMASPYFPDRVGGVTRVTLTHCSAAGSHVPCHSCWVNKLSTLCHADRVPSI